MATPISVAVLPVPADTSDGWCSWNSPAPRQFQQMSDPPQIRITITSRSTAAGFPAPPSRRCFQAVGRLQNRWPPAAVGPRDPRDGVADARCAPTSMPDASPRETTRLARSPALAAAAPTQPAPPARSRPPRRSTGRRTAPVPAHAGPAVAPAARPRSGRRRSGINARSVHAPLAGWWAFMDKTPPRAVFSRNRFELLTATVFTIDSTDHLEPKRIPNYNGPRDVQPNSARLACGSGGPNFECAMLAKAAKHSRGADPPVDRGTFKP